MIALGIAFGLIASLGASRLIGSMLFETSRNRPGHAGRSRHRISVSGVGGVLLAAGRALAVKRIVALRNE
jgi:hypothetical protein